jgi:hypothetical protein
MNKRIPMKFSYSTIADQVLEAMLKLMKGVFPWQPSAPTQFAEHVWRSPEIESSGKNISIHF